ncbi:hypothetical protein C8J25_101863 [Sphingomonas faeni]|uniref:Prohead serine protease domain-containing protein n=1 Tax=Sphingomonas faeni TaxID=185950 RepID=A0A2T5UCW7_9SPHN|nr:HK97 family phage prohead protease [Sphingomonas faeni]PTW49355.1 hypothetical protein C8J25_101863 [Sphingomonas faeni]
MEKKLFTLEEVKFASDDATGTKTFSGYGAVFGNVDSHGDVITKGAFKASLKSGETPLMFLNHDLYSLPIGKWTHFEEDDYGLKAEGVFLDTAAGNDVYTASKAGAISGLSIGYIARDVVYGKSADEPARTLKAVDLIEVSVVTIPSNAKARIADVKSFTNLNEFERELVSRGMQIEEAKTFLESLNTYHETKYKIAASLSVAKQLLSTIQGA